MRSLPRRCPRAFIAAVAAAVPLVGVLTPSALAYHWIEPRDNDAAKFVPSAQVPSGVGPLESISGKLDEMIFPDPGPGLGGGGGVPDGQDLFLIDIVSPSAFTATTVFVGVEDFDTQLFLFNAAGLGQLANDNLDPTTLFSRIVPIASDGSFALTTPGLYVIGIAGSGNFPVAAGGLPLFNQVGFDEVSGPDGPGGGLPHADWAGRLAIGSYRIELTGAFSAPAPSAAGLLSLAALAAMRRRR